MSPTPRQTRVLTFLNRVNPHSGALFESALAITASTQIPSRGKLLAHVYREICLVFMEQHSTSSRDDIYDKLDLFAVQYRSLGVSFDTPSDMPLEPEAVLMSVPRSFLRAAAEVIRLHAARGTARARARAIFESAAQRRAARPDVGPTADRWFEMSRYFTKCSHERVTPDAEMMGDRFQQEVEFFEESMSALAESAVSNLDALDEILEDANS